MKRFFLCIIISTLLSPSLALGQEEMSFDAYAKGAKAFCDNPEQPWNKTEKGGSSTASIPAYPDLSSEEVLQSIESIRSSEQVGAFREKLEVGLSKERIGRFQGFKTLEVARIAYRNAQDHTFACSVISSRIKTIDTLVQTLEKTLGAKSSEIQNKMKREREKMNALLATIGDCGGLSGDAKIPSSMSLVNTATRQYCHYGKYLEFLSQNLDANTRKIQDMESALGGSENSSAIRNTVEWERDLSLRREQLDTEWLRAQNSLPRAFVAYREMERTYAMHLMLVVLYDDYVRLRDNLSSHFNSISQLLEKAYNAQNPNK